MKRYKIIIIVVMILLVSGCGNKNYIMDGKEPVKNEATGQILQKDILCKPTDKDLKKLYEEHKDQTKIAFNDLPECKNFTFIKFIN